MTLRSQAFEAIDGLDVYTTDDEQIGTIERVLTTPDEPSQHFLLVRADALGALLGSDRLYVPEIDIAQIDEDRVVLDATADALNRPDWVTAPLWLDGERAR
jgi:hypothetical protein